MHVTLGEAARQCGISKSTLSRAIRDGKLSGERSSDTGSYRIEQSELQRYLDATAVSRATSTTAAATQPATVEEPPNPAVLQAQIDGLRQLLQQMETRIAEKDVLLAKQDARIEKILSALPAPSAPQQSQVSQHGTPIRPANSPLVNTPSSGMAPVHHSAPIKRRGWWPWRRSTG